MKKPGSLWADWLQQPLHPSAARLLAWYMVSLLAVMLIARLVLTHLGFELPARTSWLLIPSQALLTLTTVVALRNQSFVQVPLYMALLLSSVCFLSWFLFDTGGHINPLISLLLVPLAMSAAMLGWIATAVMALVVLLAYSLLTQYFVPLVAATGQPLDMAMDHSMHQAHSQGHPLMQLHLAGMWATFLLSVVLILVFVLPLALATRAQQQLIAQQRENMLQDEKLVAMATFAAGAVHKLGTPLSTLAVMIEDLQDDRNTSAEQSVQSETLAIMASQIQVCKSTLQEMMRKADSLRNDVQHPIQLPKLINHLRQQFNLLHPARQLLVDENMIPAIAVDGDDTLELALLNLLDNAARESQSNPELQLEQQSNILCLRILDQGPGVPEYVSQNLGKPFTTTRPDGLGLGLFLSNSTINRLGGTLRLRPSPQGTVTEVVLPLTEVDS